MPELASPKYRNRLPQLDGRLLLTKRARAGGAASLFRSVSFPSNQAGNGICAGEPTWRANPDWAAKVGA